VSLFSLNPFSSDGQKTPSPGTLTGQLLFTKWIVAFFALEPNFFPMAGRLAPRMDLRTLFGPLAATSGSRFPPEHPHVTKGAFSPGTVLVFFRSPSRLASCFGFFVFGFLICAPGPPLPNNRTWLLKAFKESDVETSFLSRFLFLMPPLLDSKLRELFYVVVLLPPAWT